MANELFLALEDHHHRVELAPRGVNLWRTDLEERDGARGYRSTANWQPSRVTAVFIGTVAIGITIFELSENVDMRPTESGYVRVSDDRRNPKTLSARQLVREWTIRRDLPSGRLCVRATSPYPNTKWEQRWLAVDAKKLIEQVPAIVQALEAAAPRVANLAAEAERARAVELERIEADHERRIAAEAVRARAEEVRRREEARAASRDHLVAIAAGWSDAIRMETFLDEVARRAEELEAAERERVVDNVRRARALVGGTDALERFSIWRPVHET